MNKAAALIALTGLRSRLSVEISGGKLVAAVRRAVTLQAGDQLAEGGAGEVIQQGLQEFIGEQFVRQSQVEALFEQGDEIKALLAVYRDWLGRVEMVTLCGSLPSGVPPRLFADLSRLAREAGVRAVVDTSGEALRIALEEGRPYMLKCNRSELAEVTGQALDSLDDLKRAGKIPDQAYQSRRSELKDRLRNDR